MQLADIPGMPDFYDHRARPDPAPGIPMARRRRAALVVTTHHEVRKVAAAFDELACRAENHIRDVSGRRIEARDLAAALGVSVQRPGYALAGHPRVEKEYARAARTIGPVGKAWTPKVVFYFLGVKGSQ